MRQANDFINKYQPLHLDSKTRQKSTMTKSSPNFQPSSTKWILSKNTPASKSTSTQPKNSSKIESTVRHRSTSLWRSPSPSKTNVKQIINPSLVQRVRLVRNAEKVLGRQVHKFFKKEGVHRVVKRMRVHVRGRGGKKEIPIQEKEQGLLFMFDRALKISLLMKER